MKHTEHWANQNERGNRLFLTITTLMVRYFPSWLLKPCVLFVVSYFYATSPKQRKHIQSYQKRLQRTFPQCKLPEKGAVFQQFLSFAESICDRFAVWQHQIRYEHLVVHDPDNVYAMIRQQGQRGQIFVCSHVGNVEICRALVSHHVHFKLNVLVHNQHAQAFNEALQAAGADRIQLIQVSDLDADLMMQLNQRIEQGQWIAIAADRVPIRGEKTIEIEFLGNKADMPQGAWLLAFLLKTKINTLFCVKENGHYHLKINTFLDTANWQRKNRTTHIQQAAQQFADILAQQCADYPLQWFNFYDFWGDNRS